eukprot:9133423-Alexandrium_andersonii.AAC.1
MPRYGGSPADTRQFCRLFSGLAAASHQVSSGLACVWYSSSHGKSPMHQMPSKGTESMTSE